MNKELKKMIIENRIALLSGRCVDNSKIIAKLKRKLNSLNS